MNSPLGVQKSFLSIITLDLLMGDGVESLRRLSLTAIEHATSLSSAVAFYPDF